MKRTALLVIVTMLLTGVLAGCGGNTGQKADAPVSVVCTIFPVYDWAKEILGDNPGSVQLTLLADNGADMHSFQPTAQDILTVKTADLFLYVGGESDQWVEDLIAEPESDTFKAVSLLEALGDRAKEEEVVEGMQEDGHDHYQEEGPEVDEHVWLSLKNAAFLCEQIAEDLAAVDPDHAEAYRQNTNSYLAKLDELDARYAETVEHASRKVFLFGDRFPFRYLADDYGLTYYAAFVGCSAETEASFETITFLAGKVDELGLPVVLTIEGDDHRIAETVVENTKDKNQPVLTMNSLQAVTPSEGMTYLAAMEANLAVLEEALK